MDVGEKLETARALKKRGNNFFARKMFLEAQNSYIELLGILRQDITITESDQKTEKESLVLAAHLNLAECALRLGDYLKVIDHCNTALDLDNSNVKAHFRRAKALENQADYSKAIAGYQYVLRLEPGNAIAQERQNDCQKKLASEKCMKPDSEMSGKMAKHDNNDEQTHDMEIVPEYEGFSNSRYKNCTKNPGHTAFISVKDFNIHHLPLSYREQELFDHFKLQTQIAVFVRVRGSSEHRPKHVPGASSKYPASDKRDRKCIRYGSGWFNFVILNKEQKSCPCPICQKSGLPQKQWATIHINTATHVVFDEIEGSKTTCYFFYDDDEDDFRSCPSVCNALEVSSSLTSDESTLKFITHDMELAERLYTVWKKYFFSALKIRQKYNANALSESGEYIRDMLCQLHQRLGELAKERGYQVEKLKAIVDGDPVIECLNYLQKRKHEEGDEMDGLGHILLDKLNGGDKHKFFIENISDDYKDYRSIQSFVGSAIEHYQEILMTENGKEDLLEKYSLYFFVTKTFEKTVNYARHLLREGEPDVTTPPPITVDYNKAHPLTVIASHPHGCCKKVTIGQVIDRTSKQYEYFSQYTYSNATCPGSSGSLVFILGQGAGHTGHPHSFGSNDPHGGGQRNESGLSNDI